MKKITTLTLLLLPATAGNEVVVYHFEQARAGWRFTGLDNLNE